MNTEVKAPWGPRIVEPLKGPTLKQALEEAGVKEKKVRKRLTKEQREAAYKSYLGGTTRRAIAERYGISVKTVDNIVNQARKSNILTAPVVAKEPVTEGLKIATLDHDSSFSVEGDFIIIRIPLKAAMATLLSKLYVK